ncbi:MAG: hypothetical protein NWR72_12575 [Bacteroidia bacterium]|nr:hypothetical protein [Bacteroidia bacterium]
MKDLQTSEKASSLTLEILLDYLEGKLSDHESTEVETTLEREPEWIDVLESLEMGLGQDPDIRQKAQEYRDIVSQEAFALAEKNTAPKAKVAPASVPLWKQPIWRMAAVVLLLALPASWLVTQQRQSLYDQMSEQYLQPFAATTVKGQGPTATEILEQSLTTYQQGDYAAAAHSLAEIAHSEDLSSDEQLTATMYLGLSYLFAENPQLAIVQLQEVVDMGNNIYSEHATWYLAWAHWKAGDETTAKAEFNAISQAPGNHQAQAKKILQAWK